MSLGTGCLEPCYLSLIPEMNANVGRLYRELRVFLPALVQSYEKPSFSIRHNHENITRGFLTDSIADITTLAFEDNQNYYVIASNNSGTFNDITLSITGLKFASKDSRPAEEPNEGWSRDLRYSEETSEWILDSHSMCFGDINICVISKQ